MDDNSFNLFRKHLKVGRHYDLLDDLKKGFDDNDPAVFDVKLKCQNETFNCSKFMLTSRHG